MMKVKICEFISFFQKDQGVEREQEREEFNQEITKLKAALKNQERQDNANLRRQREVFVFIIY